MNFVFRGRSPRRLCEYLHRRAIVIQVHRQRLSTWSRMHSVLIPKTVLSHKLIVIFNENHALIKSQVGIPDFSQIFLTTALATAWIVAIPHERRFINSPVR